MTGKERKTFQAFIKQGQYINANIHSLVDEDPRFKDSTGRKSCCI